MPIGPQRLILIHSGRYEYAEVELAGALQIVGPNNTGKTTLINTLQFLYLDDRKQMDFGSYTVDETREFYFPNQYSYILFECLGATGQCVIGWRGQSKTSGGEPERFFHAGPYEAADFLDEKNQVREPREVNKRLALKQFRTLKAQDQRELLLPATGSDGCGLGIIALRDSDKYHHFRETLKNLLTLSAISQEQMRDRLLMLAEIPPTRTAIDARAMFGEDYDRICGRKEQLIKFKKHQGIMENLVDAFTRRETVRGELIWRWKDLRAKRQEFEKEQAAELEKLKEAKAAFVKKADLLKSEADDRQKDITSLSEQKGELKVPLDSLAALSKEFAAFPEELERGAIANLESKVRNLDVLLINAQGESREKAEQRVAIHQNLVTDKEKTIARYDHLAVTFLRKHFNDSELDSIFRILSRELLSMSIGIDGVKITREKELLETLRNLLKHTREGIYQDESITFTLPKTGAPLAGLESVEKAREQLADHQATLKRWQEILNAIEQQEKLEKERKQYQEQIQLRTEKLYRFTKYQQEKANEPKLRVNLTKIEESIEAARKRIEKLRSLITRVESEVEEAGGAVRKHEDDFNKVMGEFNLCIFPEFSAKTRNAEDVPNDFGAAIALFLRQQEEQETLANKVNNLLQQTEQLFGDQYHEADEAETVRALQEELEALAEKEDALARDWNAHIQGLKATFDHVLKNLGEVQAAAAKLNRAFAKVQVSNLKSLKLEVLEQGDIVTWIRKLAVFEAGGLFDMDREQESAITNFRRKIQDNPVIRFTDLFTLGFTIIGVDDKKHTYHDFKQIESHGTTITIKVLFNLLLLKDQLRREDCTVPFFLDEIQTLDAANRQSILRMARQLGFIAITAAPEAIGEVDAIYILQAQKGRIILRQKHRLSIKRGQSAIIS